MLKKVPQKSFVVFYKKMLKKRHMNTAQVTRNGNFSKSYIYSIISNKPARKNIYIKTVKNIGEALGLNTKQFAKWLTEMAMYDGVKNNRQNMQATVKRVHLQEPGIDDDNYIDRYHHHEPYYHYSHIPKNIHRRNRNDEDEDHHQTFRNAYEYRKHVVGQILDRLKHLRTYDLKVFRVMANRFYYAERSRKDLFHRHTTLSR